MSKTIRIVLATLAILLATLACGGTATKRKLDLYSAPTAEATQTPLVVIWTLTPNALPSPIILEVTRTSYSGRLCVSATVAVYLRPSPSDQNYPILPLPNRAELTDLGGRSGKWIFVELGDKQGWVYGDYVDSCG
jgi:hypothetical protein